MKKAKSIFSDVQLTWAGETYTLEAGRMLNAICAMEVSVTVSELCNMVTGGQPFKLASLAGAFATALRKAGADVSDEEVYGGLFQKTDEAKTNAALAVNALLRIMVPTTNDEPAEKAPKKKQA